MQSKIHRPFECNLIPATSYRSDKRVHFSNNQFMNGILTWFDCNSSFRNLWILIFWVNFASTTLSSSWNRVLQPNFFWLLSAQNKVNELLPVNYLQGHWAWWSFSHSPLGALYLPEDWKKALVTPIFKKGDNDSLENCRHFSVSAVNY